MVENLLSLLKSYKREPKIKNFRVWQQQFLMMLR